MTSKLALGFGLLGLVGLGCNASTMIGEVPDGGQAFGSTIGAGGSGACTPPVDPKDQTFTSPTAVVGTWTGYFQGSNLAIGQDAIKLTIDQASDGTHQIHVVMGSNPPPPPATVATDLYPPDDLPGSSQQYIEGFSYPAHEVQWSGQRLKFFVQGAQAWDSWCRLQQSFAWTTENGVVSYSCAPGNGGSSRGTADGGEECFATLDSHGTMTPINCNLFWMCGGGSNRYCQCDACGCSGSVNSFGGGFDITFDGDLATGTGFFNMYLRLTRATN